MGVNSISKEKLKVSFFWPFRGDYWIICLASYYSYAVVGHPKRKHIWILAREPVLQRETYNSILEKIVEQGYNLEKMIISPPQKEYFSGNHYSNNVIQMACIQVNQPLKSNQENLHKHPVLRITFWESIVEYHIIFLVEILRDYNPYSPISRVKMVFRANIKCSIKTTNFSNVTIKNLLIQANKTYAWVLNQKTGGNSTYQCLIWGISDDIMTTISQ
jgi:hypothetical protein